MDEKTPQLSLSGLSRAMGGRGATWSELEAKLRESDQEHLPVGEESVHIESESSSSDSAA